MWALAKSERIFFPLCHVSKRLNPGFFHDLGAMPLTKDNIFSFMAINVSTGGVVRVQLAIRAISITWEPLRNLEMTRGVAVFHVVRSQRISDYAQFCRHLPPDVMSSSYIFFC